MREPRLVAVLGYSGASPAALHEVCAARLRRAEVEVGPDDVVLLSGRARGRGVMSEVELMAHSWPGHGRKVILDGRARTTRGNALAVARAARALGAREVVLVTSSWHARRAGTLARAALRGSGTGVTLAVTDEPGSLRVRLRELACWGVVPLAALALRRR